MKNLNLSYLGIIALILLASFSRIIPHAPNFTPIGAIALFGGAYFNNKHLAFIIPILSRKTIAKKILGLITFLWLSYFLSIIESGTGLIIGISTLFFIVSLMLFSDK